MKQYRLEATPAVELDIEANFNWYEREEPGLGFVFLNQLRDTYVRILDHPLGYQEPLRHSSRSHQTIPICDLLCNRA